MTDKKLSICICVYNKYAFTKSCLKDISQLPEDHEIIIVDNGSSDETQKELEGNPRITYYRSEENLGFAKGSNIAYSLSTAPNVLFLNNDIRVKSNFTDWTNDIIKWCPYGLVGPTMGQLDNQLNFVQEANKVLLGKSYMSGWCLASSKENFNKLIINDYPGPFSEEFGIAYFEDTDLSFRSRKLEISNHIVSIPVVHFGKQTSSQLNTRDLYLKARQVFIKKWNNKN
jgi:GT2 family glycosyltransferase